MKRRQKPVTVRFNPREMDADEQRRFSAALDGFLEAFVRHHVAVRYYSSGQPPMPTDPTSSGDQSDTRCSTP